MNLTIRRGRATPPIPGQQATVAQVEAFFRELNTGFEATHRSASIKAGFSREQYETLLRNPSFAERLREWEAWRLDEIEDALVKRGMQGDVQAARAVLAAKRPEVYGSKAKIELTHRVTSPDDLRSMSDEEFAQIQLALETE